MYSKLMWCGVSLVLNKLKPEHVASCSSMHLTVINHYAKDNKYIYTFSLNQKAYTCEFTFSNNICVYGNVAITDHESGDIASFYIDKSASSVKCAVSSSEYTEFYTCYGGCFIELSIYSNTVEEISTIEIVKQADSTADFMVNITTLGITMLKDINPTFIKTVFAATGARDFNKTVCLNPIFIGNDNTNVTIFSDNDRRVICLTKPCEKRKHANIIHLINSDFKQILQHTNPSNSESYMEEYVLREGDKPIRRRNYLCTCSPDLTTVQVDKKFDYSVTIIDCSIIFTKV